MRAWVAIALLACCLTAQAQKRDALFPVPEGKKRPFGLSVEAVYGAYLLEPVPANVEYEERFTRNIFNLYTEDGVLDRRSYGRYSWHGGIRCNIKFFKDRFTLSTGLTYSHLEYQTSPFQRDFFGFELSKYRHWYEIRQTYRFIEIPIGIRAGFGTNRFRIEAGPTLWISRLMHRDYYTVQTGGILYAGEDERLYTIMTSNDLDMTPVYKFPRTFLFYGADLMLRYRCYRFCGVSIGASLLRQLKSIGQVDSKVLQMHYDVPNFRIDRYVITFGVELYLF